MLFETNGMMATLSVEEAIGKKMSNLVVRLVCSDIMKKINI